MSMLRQLSRIEEQNEQPLIHRADEAWSLRGHDLTENGKKSLSKALLGSCDPNKSAEEIYAEYFFPFTLVDEDSNLSCLKSRPHQEKKIRNTMYNLKEPSKDPAYFNFTYHTDINRLAKALGKDIVIYYAHDDSFKFVEIYHDFRGFSQRAPAPLSAAAASAAQKKSSSSSSSSSELDAGVVDGFSMHPQAIRHRSKKIFSSPCLYYVLTVKRKLYKFTCCLDKVFMAGSYFFARPESTQHMWWSEDYGGLLARALGLPTPGFPIPTMLDLAFSVSRLFDMWKIKVILVNFCKSNFNQKEVRNVSRRTQPRFSYFFNLGIISPSSSSNSVAGLDLDDIELAVCFYGQTYACLLTDEFRQEVVNQYKNSSRRDKPKDNNFAKIPIVNLEERRLALAKMEAQKKAKKRKANEGSGRPTPYKRTKICDCSSCRSDTFTMNMNDDGPERLCSYFLDITDLLQLLGADSEENLALVEKMCQLSVAAMDIESMTMKVDLEAPVREGGGLQYGVVDGARLEGHFKKVQKPIMIAHLDELDGGSVKVFQASSDAEESMYKMMRDYWEHVKEQRKLIKNKKQELAHPLFEMIEEYKTAHFEVYWKWAENQSQLDPKFEIDGPGITRAWMSSFCGQLEKRLLRLVTDYTIFSFYG